MRRLFAVAMVGVGLGTAGCGVGAGSDGLHEAAVESFEKQGHSHAEAEHEADEISAMTEVAAHAELTP